MSYTRCHYAVTDSEGIEHPCDKPAPSWRWYHDCGHEELLEAACVRHENEAGRFIHALIARMTRAAQFADVLHEAHAVCADVVMDTPEERELHGRHVQQMRDLDDALRAALVMEADR